MYVALTVPGKKFRTNETSELTFWEKLLGQPVLTGVHTLWQIPVQQIIVLVYETLHTVRYLENRTKTHLIRWNLIESSIPREQNT